jgi:hypothetical protein
MTYTGNERAMLRWLYADPRGGLYGECQGETLETLWRLGLVDIPESRDPWSYVTLTKRGRLSASKMKAPK